MSDDNPQDFRRRIDDILADHLKEQGDRLDRFGQRQDLQNRILIEFSGNVHKFTDALYDIRTLKEKVEGHEKLLEGERNDGLCTDVDRLKEKEKSRTWLWGIAIAGFANGIIERAKELFLK